MHVSAPRLLILKSSRSIRQAWVIGASYGLKISSESRIKPKIEVGLGKATEQQIIFLYLFLQLCPRSPNAIIRPPLTSSSPAIDLEKQTISHQRP